MASQIVFNPRVVLSTDNSEGIAHWLYIYVNWQRSCSLKDTAKDTSSHISRAESSTRAPVSLHICLALEVAHYLSCISVLPNMSSSMAFRSSSMSV
jgi:hypothetical protein